MRYNMLYKYQYYKENSDDKYWELMVSDVAVIGSGLIVMFIVFDWIPNGIMDVLGYKRSKLANGDVDNKES